MKKKLTRRDTGVIVNVTVSVTVNVNVAITFAVIVIVSVTLNVTLTIMTNVPLTVMFTETVSLKATSHSRLCNGKLAKVTLMLSTRLHDCNVIFTVVSAIIR